MDRTRSPRPFGRGLLKLNGTAQSQGVDIAVVGAVGLQGGRNSIGRNGVVFGAALGQDVIVGDSQGESCEDLEVTTHGKDMTVGVGHLRFKGGIGHRGEIVDISGPDLHAFPDFIIGPEAESPGIMPVSWDGAGVV